MWLRPASLHSSCNGLRCRRCSFGGGWSSSAPDGDSRLGGGGFAPRYSTRMLSIHSRSLALCRAASAREFAGGKSRAKCPGSRVLHKPVNIPCYLDIRAHRYLRFKPPARGSHRLYAIDTLAPPETRSTTVRPDRDPAPDTRGPPRAVRSVCPIRRKPEPLCPRSALSELRSKRPTIQAIPHPIRPLRSVPSDTRPERPDPCELIRADPCPLCSKFESARLEHEGTGRPAGA